MQSPVFHSIGYAILNSLWQFAALWLIYFLVTNSFNLKANTKFIFSISLKLFGFILVISTFLYHFNSNKETASHSILFSIIYSTSFNNVIEQIDTYLPYLSIIYLFLVWVFVFKWISLFFGIQKYKSQGLLKIPVEWRLFTQKVSLHFGIKKEIKIYLSTIINSPLTIGYLKPIILIPFANLNQLSVEQLEAVIIHEIAHIKRSDYFINILISIIDIVLFFNPFNKLLSKAIEQEREHDCDDWVMQFHYDNISYAEALLSLATIKRKNLSLLFANQNGLVNRVKRIVGIQIKPISFFQKSVVTCSVILLVSFFGFLLNKNNAEFKTEKKLVNNSLINKSVTVPTLFSTKINENNELTVLTLKKEKFATKKNNTSEFLNSKSKLQPNSNNVDLFISKYNDVLSLQNYILEQKELKEKLNEYKTVQTNNIITIPTIDSLQKELIEVVIKTPLLILDSSKVKRRIVIL